jgi:hypothetical protein
LFIASSVSTGFRRNFPCVSTYYNFVGVHRVFTFAAVILTAASHRPAYSALARLRKTQPGKGRHGAAALQKWRRSEVGDIIFFGITFVFIGLCLLYVRAADKL